MAARRGRVLLPIMLAISGPLAARPAHRPIDTTLYSAIPAQAAPSSVATMTSPDGGTERLEVVGKRTGYVAAPMPDYTVRPPSEMGASGIPLGPLRKFRLGGDPDPDHDPVTGTWLAPFGEAYEGSSPLMTR